MIKFESEKHLQQQGYEESCFCKDGHSWVINKIINPRLLSSEHQLGHHHVAWFLTIIRIIDHINLLSQPLN